MRLGLRKPSFRKTFSAYRSQWKRTLMRFFFPFAYGRKGMGWLRDPKKASYNWWYNRTTFSVDELLGVKPRDRRFGFICCLLASAVLLPFDFIGSGVTVAKESHKEKKEQRERAKTNNTSSRTSASSQSNYTGGNTHSYSSNGSSQGNTASTATRSSTSGTKLKTNPTPAKSSESSSPRKASAGVRKTSASNPKPSISKITSSAPTVIPKLDEQVQSTYIPYTSVFEGKSTPSIPKPQPEPEYVEPDENTPKSKPKNENDQYIRKRMIIAGSYYCEQTTLDKLRIGTYFDISAEPNNPHDKDAIVLTLDGEKIGYIAKTDKIAFVTCLRLNRKIYGVITDIIFEDGKTKYEYETWFAK